MRTIVFGGNGFIGSHLVDLLLAAGHEVRVFDRIPERFRPPLPGVDYRTGEFGDPFAMAEALEGVDMVYHLVSTTVPSTSNRDPASDIESNLVSTVRLLDQMVKAGASRIAFMSSGGTVYGNPRSLPISEEHPLQPICSYGAVKVAIENYLSLYRHLHGIEPIVLRGSNPYGPRQGHRGVQGFITTALASILDKTPLSIYGDGSVIRDYLYIADLAHLCLKAGLSGQGGVYNAGSGVGHSVNDILKCISEVTGGEARAVYGPSRRFDVHKVVLDSPRASATFQWQPDISLRDGIRLTWEWMREHYPRRGASSGILEA